MVNKLKITTVGNSVGVVLPREILERLRVGKGDSLFVTETSDGVERQAYDDRFAVSGLWDVLILKQGDERPRLRR